MCPENIPELANYPTVQAFVQKHHGMQFADVRAMLRLPTGEGVNRIDNGCNFAAAATLCNLISGISVVFFDRHGRPPGPRQSPRDRGQRFRNLLTGYYPWQPGEDRGAKTDALYNFTRNPLAHTLGVLEPGDIPISINKFPEGQIQAEVDALDVAYDGGNVLLSNWLATGGNCTFLVSMPRLWSCFVLWSPIRNKCSRPRRVLQGAKGPTNGGKKNPALGPARFAPDSARRRY